VRFKVINENLQRRKQRDEIRKAQKEKQKIFSIAFFLPVFR
jgi:hypothetical protein